ncbi:hypothetical protein BAUCODRAFT_454303 [Baudoinia panamericana UAMH 10762]|uniref:Uncharacterized protein n=1 Tax=Baudoinia panamericana (strain UAMH 10762) TaxID=717646 RepID=M2NEX3_BAUPA|nr:uncharacterized protein BAUCODRAFT_454303 [Baudoinia panamericana UAMH 10762]EMC97500.1 hypothetical protein BAUCODRAFT_454303 [Baudoinia panamericana UAMH 10762]
MLLYMHARLELSCVAFTGATSCVRRTAMRWHESPVSCRQRCDCACVKQSQRRRKEWMQSQVQTEVDGGQRERKGATMGWKVPSRPR